MAKIVVAVKFKTQQHAVPPPLPTRLQVARQRRANLLCSLTKQSKKLNIHQQPQLRHINHVIFCVLQLTSLQMVALQTTTVQQPLLSTIRPYNLYTRERIQTTKMLLICWTWNLDPEEPL